MTLRSLERATGLGGRRISKVLGIDANIRLDTSVARSGYMGTALRERESAGAAHRHLVGSSVAVGVLGHARSELVRGFLGREVR